MITLDPECMLKDDFAIINGKQSLSSTIRSSYTSLGKFSDLSTPQAIAQSISTLQSNSTNTESDYVKELSTLQKSLREQSIFELPNKLKSHQQHNYTIGYLALGLSLISLIIIFVRNKASRIKQLLPPTTPLEPTEQNIELQPDEPLYNDLHPTPKPRQPVSQFTLDV